mgnify:CR=1 FL=1
MFQIIKESSSSMGIPVVELSCCILCEICVELAPHAFVINDAGFVEVLALDDYSDEDIHEAIKNCPKEIGRASCRERV